MPVVDRKYTGAAAKATLQTAMTASSPGGGGTITVSDDSGWPTGGKFEVVIDRGLANEESILMASRSGTTFTISQRGYDGTVASSHTSGEAFVEHELSGTSIQHFVDHVDDVESDPHSTKLLNNTRHDVEARHTFGAAYGTPVAPSAVATAANAGTGNNPSREDHVHDLGVGSIDASNLFAAGVVDAAAIGANAVGSSELADDAVDIAAIVAAARNILSPPGMIVAYGDAAAPTGWLLCDGSAVSRTTFATLFAVIGTDYGAGNGSTTFNVPDLRQRFPLGLATSGTGNALGATGGNIDHTHTIAHTHDLDTASSHAKVTIGVGSNSPSIRRKTVSGWTSTQDTNAQGGSASIAQTTGAELGGDTGASSAANSGSANPPFQVVQYIIRTGNTS